MSKLFLFDIDGTLTYDNVVPKSTIQAIKILKQLGYKVWIATGRNYRLAKPFMDLIDADGAICSNGQYAFDQHHVYIDAPIPKDTLVALFKDIDALDGTYHYLSKEVFATPKAHPLSFRFIDALHIERPKIDPDLYMNEAIYLVNACLQDPKDVIGLKNTYPELDFIAPNAYGFDVQLQGFGKGEALSQIIKHHQITDEIIAFGDNLNDLSLLKTAHIGVAMGNAHDDLKALASHVTSHVLDDGIWLALKHLGFIKEEIDK